MEIEEERILSRKPCSFAFRSPVRSLLSSTNLEKAVVVSPGKGNKQRTTLFINDKIFHSFFLLFIFILSTIRLIFFLFSKSHSVKFVILQKHYIYMHIFHTYRALPIFCSFYSFSYVYPFFPFLLWFSLFTYVVFSKSSTGCDKIFLFLWIIIAFHPVHIIHVFITVPRPSTRFLTIIWTHFAVTTSQVLPKF